MHSIFIRTAPRVTCALFNAHSQAITLTETLRFNVSVDGAILAAPGMQGGRVHGRLDG
jgi:hypothetical protein